MSLPDSRNTAARDQQIGKALLCELNTIDQTPHLKDAELAALLENRVTQQERDRLMGHLAACAECRQTWMLARDIGATISTQQLPAPRKTTAIPWAIAAGILVAVAATFFAIHQPGPQPGRQEISQNELPTPLVRPEPPADTPPVQPTKPTPQPHTPEQKPDAPPPARGLDQLPDHLRRAIVARIELSEQNARRLSSRQGMVVADAREVKELLKNLQGDDPTLNTASIKEVRIVGPENITKSFNPAPLKKAELRVKDGVLIIRLLEEEKD